MTKVKATDSRIGATSSRSPRMGDTIRTTQPCVVHPAGQFLHAVMCTPESLNEGRRLVASGRWVVVEKQDEKRAAIAGQ